MTAPGLLGEDSGRVRRAVVTCFAAATVVIYACVLSDTAVTFADDWLGPVMFVSMVALTAFTAREELRRDRPDRLAWSFIFAGIGLWALGCVLRAVLYPGGDGRQVPSVIDIPFLLFYPAVFVGLELLIRTRLRSYTKIPWIDGITGVLAMAAIAAAFIVEPIDSHAAGGLAASIVLLAYPIGDLILILLVAATFAIRGWQSRGPWLPLGLGLLLFGTADAIFAVAGPADSETLRLLSPLWLIGFLFINVAAWRNTDEEPEVSPEPWRLLLPAFFGLLAISIVLTAEFWDRPNGSILLAVAVLLAIGLRMGATIRESKRLEVTKIQAVTDDLTGLGNRRASSALLTEISDRAGRHDSPHAGALIIDIDRFKALNDALGHSAGDVVITSIAHAIEGAVKGRGLTVRLGGDEFAVIVPEGADETVLAGIAADITGALSVPLRMEGIDVHVDASIGGALIPAHASNGADMMSFADAAMMETKSLGMSYGLYRDQGNANPKERLRRLEELRHGISAGELIVHFQPKIRLADMRVSGVEALLRWRHPKLGLLTPVDFLHLAEQAGLMRPIAREVLQQSIAGQAAWARQGVNLAVAVNLSASNLVDLSLPVLVASEFETIGGNPKTFTFEVNENVVMSHADGSLEVLEQLRMMGCTISLDDFGAGTTSLAHLRDLPIDEVKLDRSFIQTILGNEKDRSIVEALVALAKRLDLGVVAEGVELPETAEYLEGIGCDHVQGNFASTALPANEVPAWAEWWTAGEGPARRRA
ncbi:MAG TPA: EAL domain-containing protein [Solirubrobacterales bacterium]|nr:EAL domain-containing protein [Solirubrobacterales bacterium]